jgi:hypothetical protein
VLVDANLCRYCAAKTKIQKTLIVSSIVDSVRESAPIGGFIKRIGSGEWIEVRRSQRLCFVCEAISLPSLSLFLSHATTKTGDSAAREKVRRR